MKVAVEIAGFMRGFHNCIHSWKNFMDPTHTYDFFISTYDIYGYNHMTSWDCDPEDKVDFKKIRKDIEEYGSLCEIRTQMPSDEPRYKQMFDRIQEAHELCKSWLQLVRGTNLSLDSEYSYIIRIRPDLFIPQKIIFTAPESDEAIFPEYWGFCEEATSESCRWTGGEGLCDQMAICGWEAMQTYASISQERALEEGESYGFEPSLSPESSILNNFQNKKWSHQHFHQCVLSRNSP